MTNDHLTIQAERAILGTIFAYPRALDKVASRLRTSHFTQQVYQQAYGAMLSLSADGKELDKITLQDQLERDKIPGAQKIATMLMEAASEVAGPEFIDAHVDVLLRAHKTRQLKEVGQRLVLGDATAVDRLQDMEPAEQGFSPAGGAVTDAFHEIQRINELGGKLDGITSGFIDIDKLTWGWKPGLTIVAGRPGMGKTAFALGLIEAAAFSGHAPGIFSLEMSRRALMMRMVCGCARVSMNRVRAGRLDVEEWNALSQAAERISQANIHIMDSTTGTVAELRAAMRQLKRRYGLDMGVVDYLQLMKGIREKGDNREREVASIATGLKALALDLQIPLIAVAQLNRAVEGRSVKRPCLADLRGSGQLEQDADLVFFIHRAEYYQATDENRGMAEAILAKHRDGQTGSVELVWLPELTRFESLQRGER